MAVFNPFTKAVKIKAFYILAAVLVLSSAAVTAEYRLHPDDYLNVGNQWHYNMHITLLDNVPVDITDTASITVTGTTTFEGYDATVVHFSSYFGSHYTYFYMNSDYIIRLGADYPEENGHSTFRNNNPLETLPLWVDENHNNYHFGNGEFTSTVDYPPMSWTETYDGKITYLQREYVTVPAGTFDCVTVLYRTDYTTSLGFYGYTDETTSISPGVGGVKGNVYEWMWDPYDSTGYASAYTVELTSTNFDPDPFCMVRSLYMDLNGDCKVDFIDLNLFAQSWLDCQLYPPEACGWAEEELPGPIAHWTLNDNAASTTVLDTSGSYTHGTAQRNTSILHIESGEPPYLNGALFFNGTGDYISVPDKSAWNFTGDFTIVLWAEFDSLGANRCDLVAHDQGPFETNKWLFYYSPSNSRTEFHINSPSITGQIISGNSWSANTGQWYFLAVTRLGSTYTFYRDGSPDGSQVNGTAIPDADAPLTLGWAEVAIRLHGAMDDVRIYSRALSAAEIQQLYDDAFAGGGGQPPEQ